MKNKSNDRLEGLDLFRVVSVCVIYLFHSYNHLGGGKYGLFNEFISMGAVFMSAFFLLSGYVLFYSYRFWNLMNIEKIKIYYFKRIIEIMPQYYVCAIIYMVLSADTIIQTELLLAPIEILGLQSVFSSLFTYTHNGATWFVSCLLICYCCFPFVQEQVKQMSTKTKVKIILFCMAVLLYSPFVQMYFECNAIYTNPFFRLLEFTIGVCLCSMKSELESNKRFSIIYSWKAFGIESLTLITGITIAVKIGIPKNYMLYSWCALPVFVLMIISLSGLKKIPFGSKGIKYLSSISYMFYLASVFSWRISDWIMQRCEMENNLSKILISLMVSLTLGALGHEMLEKRLLKVLISNCAINL